MKSPTRQVFDESMTRFMRKALDSVSVSIGDEDLRIAHLRSDGLVTELVKVVKSDIRGIAEAELPRIVKKALSEVGLRHTHGFCVIPSNLATTKNIEIPSVDPAEIRSIINLQAGRHTPYSREEIIIDYLPIGVFQRNYTKVLLVIVNRNVIKKHLSVLEEGGLKVTKILFVPEGVARFYSKALHLDENSAPLGIIDVGNHFTEFIIAFRHTVLACRSVPIGMIHLNAEGAAAVERLTTELRKSLEAYQSEDIEKIPEAYVLTKDHPEMKELQMVFREILKANVKVVSYLDHLKVAASARKSVEEMGESFLDVVAPAAMMGGSQLDLLPEEVKLQRSIEQQAREAIKSAILAVILIVFLCAWFLTKIYFKSSFLAKLKEDHEPRREEAEILGHISEKTSIIKDHLNNRLVSLNTINELYRIIPDEIYLTSILLEENGSIVIQGTSESMSRVFTLITALEESELFKNVKTNSTTAKKERGKDMAAFELTFKLESAKEEDDSEAASENETQRARK